MMRLAEEQRYVQFAQTIELALCITVPPHHDKVGLQRDDAFEIERLVVAHARQLSAPRGG